MTGAFATINLKLFAVIKHRIPADEGQIFGLAAESPEQADKFQHNPEQRGKAGHDPAEDGNNAAQPARTMKISSTSA